jgi:hypothetical protein
MDVAIVGVVGTLFGVIVGAVGSYVIDRRGWRRAESITARLLVAQLWRYVWADTPWADLRVRRAQLRVRLHTLDIPDELWDRLDAAVLACWKEARASLHQDADDASGYIGTDNVAALESAAAAVDGWLAGAAAPNHAFAVEDGLDGGLIFGAGDLCGEAGLVLVGSGAGVEVSDLRSELRHLAAESSVVVVEGLVVLLGGVVVGAHRSGVLTLAVV